MPKESRLGRILGRSLIAARLKWLGFALLVPLVACFVRVSGSRALRYDGFYLFARISAGLGVLFLLIGWGTEVITRNQVRKETR